jgi:hypothetical protein
MSTCQIDDWSLLKHDYTHLSISSNTPDVNRYE